MAAKQSTPRKNLLFIVIDGLGDKRVKGHPTPLENPKLDALHGLARRSVTGLVRTVPGIAPESDTGIMSLLGVSLKHYSGRGPLEALGSGLPFKDGDLAVRCNFATSFGTTILDRRVRRTLTTPEAKLLEKTINKKVMLAEGSFTFKSTVAHRCVVVFRSKKRLSAKITNTDPAYRVGKDGVPEALAHFDKHLRHARPLAKEAQFTADLVNNFTSQAVVALTDDPVNIARLRKRLAPADLILSRDAGTHLPKVVSLSKQFKTKWAIIADMPLERGIAKVLGMDIVPIPMGDNSPKSLGMRVAKTIDAMKKYGCIYIHLKGPDVYGHDGDFEGKKRSVQEINDAYFKPLLKRIDLDKTIICVTADHATPCGMHGHSADPVPVLIYGNGRMDKVVSFSEEACAKGSLKTLKGNDIMPLLRKIYLGR